MSGIPISGATAASIDSWATTLRDFPEQEQEERRTNDQRWRHACKELDMVRKETVAMRQQLALAQERCHRFGLYVVARVFGWRCSSELWQAVFKWIDHLEMGMLQRAWSEWTRWVRSLPQGEAVSALESTGALEPDERDEMIEKAEAMRVHYEGLLREQDSVLLEQDALFHLRVMEELQQKATAMMKPRVLRGCAGG